MQRHQISYQVSQKHQKFGSFNIFFVTSTLNNLTKRTMSRNSFIIRICWVFIFANRYTYIYLKYPIPHYGGVALYITTYMQQYLPYSLLAITHYNPRFYYISHDKVKALWSCVVMPLLAAGYQDEVNAAEEVEDEEKEVRETKNTHVLCSPLVLLISC